MCVCLFAGGGGGNAGGVLVCLSGDVLLGDRAAAFVGRPYSSLRLAPLGRRVCVVSGAA